MRTLLLAATLTFAALPMHADDVGDLLDAGRKAIARNDAAGAETNFTKAIAAVDPLDKRLTSGAMEYSTFLRKTPPPNEKAGYEKAKEILTSALSRQKAAKLEPIGTVTLLIALSETRSMLRDAPGYEATLADLAATWIAAVGADKPVVANNLVRLAAVYERAGKFPEATKAIEQAVAILKASYGDNDPSVGYALGSLARLQMRAGQKEEATKSAQTAKLIMEKTIDAKAVSAGNGVTFPKIKTRKEPEYAEEARKSRIQGSITLSLVVGEDGIPRNIHVLVPLGAGLDAKAIEAVKAWVFEPGLKNDEPVAVKATIEVNLRLI